MPILKKNSPKKDTLNGYTLEANMAKQPGLTTQTIITIPARNMQNTKRTSYPALPANTVFPSWDTGDLPQYVKENEGFLPLSARDQAAWMTAMRDPKKLVDGTKLTHDQCHRMCAWIWGFGLDDRIVYAQLKRYQKNGNWYVWHDACGCPVIQLILTPGTMDGESTRIPIPMEDLFLVETDWNAPGWLPSSALKFSRVFPAFAREMRINNLIPIGFKEQWMLMAKMLLFMHENPPIDGFPVI